MNIVNWDEAPEGATHWDTACNGWCKDGYFWISPDKEWWPMRHIGWGTDRYIPKPTMWKTPHIEPDDESSAHRILEQSMAHMRDRASTYDKPEGERSMSATVKAFEAITGIKMTETQGWLFMAALKAVRSQQGAYRADSFEDGAAYFALAGESAAKESK